MLIVHSIQNIFASKAFLRYIIQMTWNKKKNSYFIDIAYTTLIHYFSAIVQVDAKEVMGTSG